MGLINLEPDSEEQKPKLDRSSSGERSMGWALLEVLAGLGGFMALALMFVGLGPKMGVNVGSWWMVPLVTVVPLAVVGGAGYFFKSRAMIIGALVPCCVMLLSCGTCAALVSGMR